MKKLKNLTKIDASSNNKTKTCNDKDDCKMILSLKIK